jgi:NAD(P)-dependent dehydrogenase (short-subunit alcohol dehydrogenase family)
VTKDHALLVGASRGLGRVTALDFAQRGMAVSVISRRPPAPSADPNPSYWAADLCQPASVLDALIGILARDGNPQRLVFFQRHRGDRPDWEAEIATSLTATRHLIDALVEIHDLRNCAIVLVSSINAHLISAHLPLSYHIAKAGLVQMARHYAAVLGPRGIRVNSVSPGTFLKPESQHVLLDDAERRRFHERLSPLGRLGTAAEVASVIRFLSGPEASFVTGQDLIVDGGVSIRFQESLPSTP